MKIITLVENSTSNKDLKFTHGLSLYIETNKHKILFDLGPDDTFYKNANRLGVNISDVDTVIISHGHYDHGGGMKTFLANNQKAKIFIHGEAFKDHYSKLIGPIKVKIGLDKKYMDHERVIIVKDNLFLDDELLLISKIREDFIKPEGNKRLFVKGENGLELDDFSHEQNLLIKEDGKKVLLTGCSHRGIVNIVKQVESDIKEPIDYIIGGFHLKSHNKKGDNTESINHIGKMLLGMHGRFFTCHCTGYEPYNLLKDQMGDKLGYLSTGDEIDI